MLKKIALTTIIASQLVGMAYTASVIKISHDLMKEKGEDYDPLTAPFEAAGRFHDKMFNLFTK